MIAIFFIRRPPCLYASVTWISDAKQRCALVKSVSHLFAPLRCSYSQACWSYLSLALLWNRFIHFVQISANPPIDHRAPSFFWHSYGYGTEVKQNLNAGQDTVVKWSKGFIYGGTTQGTLGQPSSTTEHQGTELALRETGNTSSPPEPQNTLTQQRKAARHPSTDRQAQPA